MLYDKEGYEYKFISQRGHFSIIKSLGPTEYIVVRFLKTKNNTIIDMSRFGRWYFWDLEKARDFVRFMLKHE